MFSKICKINCASIVLCTKKTQNYIQKNKFVKRSENNYSSNYSWYQQVIWKRIVSLKIWELVSFFESVLRSNLYRKKLKRKNCRLNIDKIFYSPRQQLLLRTLTNRNCHLPRWAKVFLLLFFAIFKKEFLKMRRNKCRLLKCNPLINPSIVE